MALTINTNISSLVAQTNLAKATSSLNTAIERMTTGYKINHAADNAAGYSIARNWETQLGSLDVASDNAATGADMLATLEDTYALVTSHIQRVRDLTEQAANGTYGSQSLKAIQSEIKARLEEVDRISKNCEFNGLKMMNNSIGEIALQVGLYNSEDSQIVLDESLFAAADVASLFNMTDAEAVANACAGLNEDGDIVGNQSDMLLTIDNVINTISGRITTLGAAQNRIESAIESIDVQSENITSSLSTLRDADIAEESSNYIQAQILQQAAATLLSTANQTPSIALNLL
ncbi:MAG: flagellin FliC [Cyanobacteria bacterium SIG28]|nr:flagellin FliC [Cyanobacteria bacterium SIG28]